MAEMSCSQLLIDTATYVIAHNQFTYIDIQHLHFYIPFAELGKIGRIKLVLKLLLMLRVVQHPVMFTVAETLHTSPEAEVN